MKEIIHQLTDFLRYADIRDEVKQIFIVKSKCFK